MTTVIALLANRCGLSNREAAIYLNVRKDTFNAWSSGRNPAKPWSMAALRTLYAEIAGAAANALIAIKGAVPAGETVELGYCADDYGAQQLGLPFASCHRAMLGLIIAGLPDHAIRLVPRGSTSGTAAAMAAHGL